MHEVCTVPYVEVCLHVHVVCIIMAIATKMISKSLKRAAAIAT